MNKMSKRTFAAIKVKPEGKLAETIQLINSELQNEKMKWVEFENIHITLHFFGETSIESIPDITESFKEIAQQFEPFQLRLSNLGVFKNLRRPRVLWVGIEPNDTIEQLYDTIQSNVAELGFDTDSRGFRPHLTLARIKFVDNLRKFRKLITQYADTHFQSVDVNEFTFYESKLTPQGPIYTPIETFTLGE